MMEEKNYTGIIPEHQSGAIIDTESSVELDTEEQAKAFFEVAKTRLQDVNRWNEVAGAISANFQLLDASGNEVNRPAQKGDYFKIDIPGPGSVSGEGYDFVQIEDVKETSTDGVDSIGFRVRPSTSPLNAKQDTAHFYSPESTSSFTVTREGNKVTAAVYDRNTKPNTDANTITDKIRDAVVGAGGVVAFSKIQWKALASGLVKKD